METETLTHRREPHAAFDALEIVREELLRRFLRVRAATDWICEPLHVEDCVVQTSTECSPVKWQLAHTTWFFETFVLAPHARGYRLFHPQFGYLFNSYYNTIGERTPRDMRGLMSRPTLAEVLAYRAHVRHAMERFILDADSDLLRQLAPIIILGINHEQQHQELMITDVKTVLSMNPLRPVYRAREINSSEVHPLHWISFDEGLIEIGAQLGSDVPFFLTGGTAMALDRGAEIYDLPDVAEEPVLLLSPAVHVATGPAYSALGRSLTFTALSSSINSFQAFVRTLESGRSARAASAFSANDFETVVFRQYPQLRKIAARLRSLGVRGVRMTGSGSTIFALFASKEERARAERMLNGDRVLGDCRLMRSELVSRRSYRRMWRRQLREHLNPNEVLWPPRSRYAQ